VILVDITVTLKKKLPQYILLFCQMNIKIVAFLHSLHIVHINYVSVLQGPFYLGRIGVGCCLEWMLHCLDLVTKCQHLSLRAPNYDVPCYYSTFLSFKCNEYHTFS